MYLFLTKLYFQITFHIADNIILPWIWESNIHAFLMWYSEKDTVKYFSSLKQCLQWASRMSLEGQETRPSSSRSTCRDRWSQIRAVQPAASSRDPGPLVFASVSVTSLLPRDHHPAHPVVICALIPYCFCFPDQTFPIIWSFLKKIIYALFVGPSNSWH